MLLWSLLGDGLEVRLEVTHRARGAVTARDEVEVVFISVSVPGGPTRGVRCAMSRAAFEESGLPPGSDALLWLYREEIERRLPEILRWRPPGPETHPEAYYDLRLGGAEQKVARRCAS